MIAATPVHYVPATFTPLRSELLRHLLSVLHPIGSEFAVRAPIPSIRETGEFRGLRLAWIRNPHRVRLFAPGER